MASGTNAQRPTLLVFDFDETLVNINSDLLPFKSPDIIPCGAPLLSHLRALSQKLGAGSWTRVMRVMLAVLARLPGYCKRDLVQCLRSVQMDEVLKRALRRLAHHGRGEAQIEGKSEKGSEAGHVEMVIASDANQTFISEILDANGIGNGVFSGVYTNYADWKTESFLSAEDEVLVEGILADLKAENTEVSKTNAGNIIDGLVGHEPTLHVRPFQSPDSPHGCPRCAANMCKSDILGQVRKECISRLPSSRTTGPDLEQRIRVVYSGDGHNDYCPALSLGPGDVLLAREGYSLSKMLARDAARDAAPGNSGKGAPSAGQTDGTSTNDTRAEDQRVVAETLFWRTQEDLGKLLLEVVYGKGSTGSQNEALRDNLNSIERLEQLSQDFSKKAAL